MGQDGEEAAELVATIRGEHVVMKNWFMGPSHTAQELRKRYGDYPGLWKEVLNWPGWKEARKAYLADQQKKESNASSATSSAVPRKRRSRWGTADSTNDGNDENSNKRRSRWGREDSSSSAARSNNSGMVPAVPLPGLPGMPANLAPQDQEKMKNLQSRLRVTNEKLQNLEAEAARVDALPRGHRDRSPSPPPVYGADGKRKNTRAVRWRERLSAERHDLLEEIMSLNPATRKSGLFKRKRSKKIRIPVEEHPTYNFIGLLIGPRGKTQRELESKTGCKIAIRGRGSVKEGARGRRDGKMMEGDNEPLHVVITGDDQQSVDAATEMIEHMLVVIDDEKNVHKQQQLRELALLNGTLKEDEFCSICAEKGHRSFECPKRFSMNKPATTVKCAICGDTSHPTRDCTQKEAAAGQANPQELDSDYMSFMAELDGKKVEKAPASENASAPAKPERAVDTTPSVGSLPVPSGGPVPGAPPPSTSLPPPPPPPTTTGPPAGVPPPPGSSLPPPSHQPHVPGAPYGQPAGQANYYGHSQQSSGQQYYGGPGQFPPPPPGQAPPYQQHQQQQQYGQQPQQAYQQQPHQARPGEETAAWDPSAYYGYGGGQGDAGGFQWW